MAWWSCAGYHSCWTCEIETARGSVIDDELTLNSQEGTWILTSDGSAETGLGLSASYGDWWCQLVPQGSDASSMSTLS